MQTQRWTILTLRLIAVLIAGAAIGCGDDSSAKSPSTGGSKDGGGGGSVTESSNVGDSVAEMITAADGGEVALKDAGIMLMIPAGALSKDTEITAEVVAKADLPGAADLVGDAVQFGPDGLKFDMPVELTIDLGDAKMPKDMMATISWLDTKTDKWMDLEGAKVVDGAVVAKTTHFTIFAVRFVVNAAGQVVQEGGQCSGGFKACGGDIEGTWNVTSGCANLTMPIDAAPGCAGASFEIGIDFTGDVTFAAGAITGSLMVESSQTQTVPKTCSSNNGMCKVPAENEVVTDTGDACKTVKAESKIQDLDSTYVIIGNTIDITNNNATDAGASDTAPKPPSEYCVTGDNLVILGHEDNGVDIQWTAKRK